MEDKTDNKRKAEQYLKSVSEAVKRKNNGGPSTISHPFVLQSPETIERVHSQIHRYLVGLDNIKPIDYCAAVSDKPGLYQITINDGMVYMIPMSNLFLFHAYIFDLVMIADRNDPCREVKFLFELWFNGYIDAHSIPAVTDVRYKYTGKILAELFHIENEEDCTVYVKMMNKAYKKYQLITNHVYSNVKKSFVFLFSCWFKT